MYVDKNFTTRQVVTYLMRMQDEEQYLGDQRGSVARGQSTAVITADSISGVC